MKMINKGENNKLNQKKVELSLKVSKEEYYLRRKEFNEADKKIYQMLFFDFIFLGFIIEFIKAPFNSLYGCSLYLIMVVSLILSILFLLNGFWPKSFNAPFFVFKKKYSFFSNIKILKNQYDISWNSLDKKIFSKNNSLKISIILLLFSLIIGTIIKVIQTGGYS